MFSDGQSTDRTTGRTSCLPKIFEELEPESRTLFTLVWQVLKQTRNPALPLDRPAHRSMNSSWENICFLGQTDRWLCNLILLIGLQRGDFSFVFCTTQKTRLHSRLDPTARSINQAVINKRNGMGREGMASVVDLRLDDKLGVIYWIANWVSRRPTITQWNHSNSRGFCSVVTGISKCYITHLIKFASLLAASSFAVWVSSNSRLVRLLARWPRWRRQEFKNIADFPQHKSLFRIQKSLIKNLALLSRLRRFSIQMPYNFSLRCLLEAAADAAAVENLNKRTRAN